MLGAIDTGGTAEAPVVAERAHVAAVAADATYPPMDPPSAVGDAVVHNPPASSDHQVCRGDCGTVIAYRTPAMHRCGFFR